MTGIRSSEPSIYKFIVNFEIGIYNLYRAAKFRKRKSDTYLNSSGHVIVYFTPCNGGSWIRGRSAADDSELTLRHGLAFGFDGYNGYSVKNKIKVKRTKNRLRVRKLSTKFKNFTCVRLDFYRWSPGQQTRIQVRWFFLKWLYTHIDQKRTNQLDE